MVSRRKILSRSSDDLNFEAKQDLHDEEDVWHQKEKLFKVRCIQISFNSFVVRSVIACCTNGYDRADISQSRLWD